MPVIVRRYKIHNSTNAFLTSLCSKKVLEYRMPKLPGKPREQVTSLTPRLHTLFLRRPAKARVPLYRTARVREACTWRVSPTKKTPTSQGRWLKWQLQPRPLQLEMPLALRAEPPIQRTQPFSVRLAHQPHSQTATKHPPLNLPPPAATTHPTGAASRVPSSY